MIRTIFIFSFILFNIILQVRTSFTKGKNELKCTTSNDFRSYAHCIKKREATNWCSAQGCTTCIGSSCQVSCKGFSCGNCPNGNCCNGRNCNACYNDNCCTTPSCNYCLNTCRQACTTGPTCLNTCSQQCPNTSHEVFIVPSKLQNNGRQNAVVYVKGTPHTGQVTSGVIPNGQRSAIVNVNGIDHTATVLSLTPTYPKPCQTGPCSSTCSNNGKCCKDDNCNSNCQTEDDSNKCLIEETKGRDTSIVYSNPLINRFNVTTVINITNVINNTNEIDSPIFVNSTNLNNFTLPNLAPNQSQRIIYQNYYQQLQQGCCHVVHPSQCFNNHIYPYRHCFRRSHQECSNLCTSQFVHLIPNITPQPNQPNQCHYIRSYPYVYCGLNAIQNCDSCYVCNGQYNPNACVRQNGCSDICRQTFLPPRFQQSQPIVPYYQPHHGSYQAVHPGTLEYQQIMGYLQTQRAYHPQGGVPLQYG